MALAALFPAPVAPTADDHDRPRTANPLPCHLLVAGSLILFGYPGGHDFDAPTFWLGTTLVGLVLARQWIAARDNQRLARDRGGA